jgi:PAS domain S-box-containing protein
MSGSERSADRLTLLGQAVEGAPVCVLVADAEMRYVAVNAYACELLGYTEAELLTMRVTDIATYDEAPKEYSSMVSTAYLRGTSRIRCKDGEEVVLRYVAGEVTVGGAPLYVSVGSPLFPDEEPAS